MTYSNTGSQPNPVNYTSQYTVTTTTTTEAKAISQIPERKEIVVESRQVQSMPVKTEVEARPSLLTPYRQTSIIFFLQLSSLFFLFSQKEPYNKLTSFTKIFNLKKF